MNKSLIWTIALGIITLSICGTLIYLNSNPHVISIDENTRDAIQSINNNTWNCPEISETGRYVFTNGILISPSGEKLECERVEKEDKS